MVPWYDVPWCTSLKLHQSNPPTPPSPPTYWTLGGIFELGNTGGLRESLLTPLWITLASAPDWSKSYSKSNLIYNDLSAPSNPTLNTIKYNTSKKFLALVSPFVNPSFYLHMLLFFYTYD